MMRFLPILPALLFTSAFLGCSDEELAGNIDGGSSRDASMPRTDGGTEIDAGQTVDAGASVDAGTITDAGQIDAGGAADAAGSACTGTPWGTVPHGFTGPAYASSMPAGPCDYELRTCTNGTMSGSYTSTSCLAGCTETPWGDVASGFSGTAYRDPFAAYLRTCADTSELRTCTNGTMSGTFRNTSCLQYACEFGGIHFLVASAGHDRDIAPSGFWGCQFNGEWTRMENGDPNRFGTPCAWEYEPGETIWLENGTCGYDRSTGERHRCVSGIIINDSAVCPAGP